MDKIVVAGGKQLKGTIPVSGSKNAVLPIMAATLLADGEYRLHNVPELRDVITMQKMLSGIGSRVSMESHAMRILSPPSPRLEAPYDLVKTMRASIYVLGPMVSRFGYARVSLPGGCAWGPRPVNLHIEGLQKLGAQINIEEGYIIAKAKRLKGAHIVFDTPSVGATGTLLMASVLAEGRTVIENAAMEPEMTSLVSFLKKMGAKISGEGSPLLEIEGVQTLSASNMDIIADRIETGTFLAACHIVGGKIRVTGTNPSYVTAVVQKLRDSGALIREGSDWIEIESDGKCQPINVTTAVYPGFPTDMQAQWMALMSIAGGSSIIRDEIFLDRFTHVAELKRLGADITLDNNVAIVKGVKKLSGAPVMSTDLRASASLIIAGLVACGRTDISRVYHIDRGYEHIEVKLKDVGAEIWREQEDLVT